MTLCSIGLNDVRLVPKAEAVGITVYISIEERSNSKVNNEYCTGIDFLKVDLAF